GLSQALKGRVVVGRVAQHDDVAVVIGGGAQHRRPADVYVLDGVFKRHVLARDGRLEGVEVAGHQVYAGDAVLGQLTLVLRQGETRQQAAVDGRVQRLDAAVQHLREARHVRHGGY